MFKQNITYGVAIICGSQYRCYTMEITGRHVEKKLIASDCVKLQKRHKKGGQSALRIDRTAKDKELWYVKDVSETIVESFMKNNNTEYLIEKIIIAGYGDIKNKVMSQDLFQQYFKNRILKVMNVAEINDSTIARIYDDCYDLLETKENIIAKKVVIEFNDIIRSNSDMTSIGYDEVVNDLEEKILCRVLYTEKLSYDKLEKVKLLINYDCEFVYVPSFMSFYGDLVGVKWFVNI